MSNDLHKLCIVGRKRQEKIYIDDKQLQGVEALELTMTPTINTVCLKIALDEVDIDLDTEIKANE